ncbi:MAG: outer membrane beta-barrel protein [Balneolaceae bacterium]
MRKLTNLLLATLFACTFNQLAIAQEAGDISVGAGAVYGFDMEEVGIQAVGIYTLNENMRVGADFIYWLTDAEFGDYTAFEINGNFHYIFYNENDLLLYGLGSLGLHYVSYSFNMFGFSEDVTDSELGLGVGAGLEYSIGNLKLYTEPRLFLSGIDQFAISAGLRLPI